MTPQAIVKVAFPKVGLFFLIQVTEQISLTGIYLF